MKVIIFGATGMVGQGVLRECLVSPRVGTVLSIVRRPTGRSHPKLREIVHADMHDIAPIAEELAGFDSCLFCLGISSVGLSEQQYADVTHDMTLHVASTLARVNPSMSFVYVSAAGSNLTEKGWVMWARVRGRTENGLFRLPFAHVVSVRPAGIRPLHGIRSHAAYINLAYRVLKPILPFAQRLFPAYMTNSEELARAMLYLAEHRQADPVVENRDFARLARAFKKES